MRLLTAILFSMLFLLTPVSAQQKYVSGKALLTGVSESGATTTTTTIEFPLKATDGWHIYSTGLEGNGPVSARLVTDSISGVLLRDGLQFTGAEKKQYDALFGMEVRFFERQVTFLQHIDIIQPDFYISGYLVYGACNDVSCLPPQRVEFTFSGASDVSAASVAGQNTVSDLTAIPGFNASTWKPAALSAPVGNKQHRGLLWLFLISMSGGFLALLTPCVWPIIPMTVSYFLKRTEGRGSGAGGALIYGACIVAIYVTLGIAVTLLFGASALNSLSTNAVVNIVFFLVLVAFACSFLGFFDLRLPSSWSTGTSRRAGTKGGVWGIFFMALTLTLVSFSCTGPIIGFLLVDAAQNGTLMAPLVGMAGFSLAMAIPFTLFAMFPGWLKAMPKSGGWMERVKVVLAFVELAFSLKFLSVADMAYGWGILPRDLFILLWIVMAVLLGLYLFGVINLHKGSVREKPGQAGIAGGILSLLFAVWMVPGLFGAPLKAISAFTPPMNTQHNTRLSSHVEPVATDYAQALELSRQTGKPVLMDFTGYGCVNCRKMEASVWTEPKVADKIKSDYVLVSLFVDDKTPLEGGPVTVMEQGQPVKLRTVGDKWSLLQRYKFGANAQPFYVIVNADGQALAGPYTFDTDINRFMDFLNR